MSREDIIRMAKEAGLTQIRFCRWGGYLDDLMRFAALVAAAEREACAKVCAWEWKKQGPTADLMADLRTALAAEQPKQEPVAWMFVNLDGECEQIVYGTPPTDDDSITPLYTAPPRREET